MPKSANVPLPVACPPAGFAFDPAPATTLPREGSYLPLPALVPIPIGLTLEEAVGQHKNPRVLAVKCGLESRFNPVKAVA
jgi:hypothetical protein